MHRIDVTISRRLLPPISRYGKTMDSCRRSCRNSKTSHTKGGGKGGFLAPEKGQFPLGKRGVKAPSNGNHNLVQVRNGWLGFCFGPRTLIMAEKKQKILEKGAFTEFSVPISAMHYKLIKEKAPHQLIGAEKVLRDFMSECGPLEVVPHRLLKCDWQNSADRKRGQWIGATSKNCQA